MGVFKADKMRQSLFQKDNILINSTLWFNCRESCNKNEHLIARFWDYIQVK